MNSESSFCFKTPTEGQYSAITRDAPLTLIQHRVRRTSIEEQHLILRLGIILKPQTRKVQPSIIMETTKLHPVTVLVRDHLLQQRDLGRRVQKDSVGLVRGLLHSETVCRVVRAQEPTVLPGLNILFPHLCPFLYIGLGFEPLDPVGNMTHRPTEQRFPGAFAPVFNRRCFGPSRE